MKSLCLEGTRAAEWDLRVAKVGELNLPMGRLSNWPMVLVMPFEKYTQIGVLALGAYIALTSNNPLSLGALIGFMMLGGRVAAPLVNLARLLQDVQEARHGALAGRLGAQPSDREARSDPRLAAEIRGCDQLRGGDLQVRRQPRPRRLDRISFSIAPGRCSAWSAARALANPRSPACSWASTATIQAR